MEFIYLNIWSKVGMYQESGCGPKGPAGALRRLSNCFPDQWLKKVNCYSVCSKRSYTDNSWKIKIHFIVGCCSKKIYSLNVARKQSGMDRKIIEPYSQN
jgi:hypothetical protein